MVQHKKERMLKPPNTDMSESQNTEFFSPIGKRPYISKPSYKTQSKHHINSSIVRKRVFSNVMSMIVTVGLGLASTHD